MGLRTLEHIRWKFFIAIPIHLNPLTIVVNISVDVTGVLDMLLATVYYLIIVKQCSLMSEFWK